MSESKSKSTSEGVDLTHIPTPEEVIAENAKRERFASSVISINDFPPYQPEAENPNILIKGRWLERGGSAWWISTAGTGKSIASVQLAYCWGAGLDFAGLSPHKPIRSWIVQSEDSPSRVTIDREDIVAELTERYDSVDWNAIGRSNVKFVRISGKVGVDFLKELDALLACSDSLCEKPDLVIINPFMAFVGGPVTDGGYVTPFLRGGDIAGHHTDGLQCVLERHNIAALIFHHTPKPPKDGEIASWLKSQFPEYQGAGSSDITNWGRSFITMMKVQDHSNMVCMCAGKNGNEIGWELINGSRRKYMAWSSGTSITGGLRHAWRELTGAEYDDVVAKEKKTSDEEIDKAAEEIAEHLKKVSMNIRQLDSEFSDRYRRSVLRPALTAIKASPSRFRLSVKKMLVGNNWVSFIGQAESIEKAANLYRQQYAIDATRRTYGKPRSLGDDRNEKDPELPF